MVSDAHGNVGYATAAECEAAINGGTAKFYQPYTHQPQLECVGKTDVKVMRLGELDGYSKGTCDLGVGRRDSRDGVGRLLIGKYVPFSPEMSVNVYLDSQGNVDRSHQSRRCHQGMEAWQGMGWKSIECASAVLLRY